MRVNKKLLEIFSFEKPASLLNGAPSGKPLCKGVLVGMCVDYPIEKLFRGIVFDNLH